MTNRNLFDSYFDALIPAVNAITDDDLDAALDAHAKAGDLLRAERQDRLERASEVLAESQRGAA